MVVHPELSWQDQHYRNLSAHLENLIMIEQNTKDHQTRLQLVTLRRALAMELNEIERRMKIIKKLEPGA